MLGEYCGERARSQHGLSPPPETPNRIPPGPAALEREGRFPFVLIPINCINYLLCSWLGGGLASLSPSWNFGKTPQKKPLQPLPQAHNDIPPAPSHREGASPGRALRKIISSLLFWTAQVLPQGSESRLNQTIQGREKRSN